MLPIAATMVRESMRRQYEKPVATAARGTRAGERPAQARPVAQRLRALRPQAIR
jgi:hypothetical protein